MNEKRLPHNNLPAEQEVPATLFKQKRKLSTVFIETKRNHFLKRRNLWKRSKEKIFR